MSSKKRKSAATCNVCRARKVRCDRKLPCSSCVKHKTTQECSYEISYAGRETPVFVGPSPVPAVVPSPKPEPDLAFRPSLVPNLAFGVPQRSPDGTHVYPAPLRPDSGRSNGNGGYSHFLQGQADPAQAADLPQVLSSMGPSASITGVGSVLPAPVNLPTIPAIPHIPDLAMGFGQPTYPRADDISGPNDKVYLVPTSSAKALASFTKFSEVIGVNPILDRSERINFYEGYSSISFDPEVMDEINHGPFSWHSLVRADPGLSQLWSFMFNMKPSMDQKGPANIYTKAIKAHAEPAQVEILDRIRRQQVKKFGLKPNGTSRPVPLGLTFNDPNYEKQDVAIAQRLLGVLPSKKIIWWHVDRFFRLIYPFYPYLDERLFRAGIAQMLGPQEYSDAKVGDIKITLQTEYALIGIFCIVLRLSYLSLISNDTGKNTQMAESGEPLTRTLLSHPIGIEVIDLAHVCLSHCQTYNRYNLTIFQLVVYMRIYMEKSPENPDGPARETYQVNNAVLIQMAYIIGLNREPDNLGGMLADERTNHIRRKLWVFVQTKDVLNCLKFGSHFSSCMVFADTRFPALTATNGNSLIPGVDEYVEKSFRPQRELLPLMKKAAEQILQVLNGSSLSDLTEAVNALERFIFKNLWCLRECKKSYASNSVDSIGPLLSAPVFILVHVFLMSIYFRLSGHYEKKQQPALSFFYCKKLMVLITQEFLPFVHEILDMSHPYLEYTAQLMINPQLDYYLHKSVSFMSAWLIRLGNQIHFKTNVRDSSHETRLKYLMRTFASCFKVCLLGIIKMNHRYCYAWRIGVIYSYTLSCLSLDKFYDILQGSHSAMIPSIQYSDEQLADLWNAIEPLIEGVNLKKYSSYWKVVSELLKLGKGAVKPGPFDPAGTAVIFEGLPLNARDAGIQVTGPTPPAPENPIDQSWFPAFGENPDMNVMMEMFFDGDDPLLDPSRGFPANLAKENYGYYR